MVEAESAAIGRPPEEVGSIIGTFLALLRLRRQLGMEGDEFLQSLAAYVAEAAKKKDEPRLVDLWGRGLPQIRQALDEDGSFAVLDKATELVYSHQNVLNDVRLLTDIRPVYDKGARTILRMVVTHQLVLVYMDGSSVKRLYVTVDAEDVQKLEEQCRRAKDKAGVVQRSLEDKPWRTTVIGGSNEHPSG